MEEKQSVKGLRDYFQGIIVDMKKENDSYYQTKQHSTSQQPQRESVSRQSLTINLDQLKKNEQIDSKKEDKYLKIIEQLKSKIKKYEEKEESCDYTKLLQIFEAQKLQLLSLQEMNERINEELNQANNTISNLEQQLQQKTQENQKQSFQQSYCNFGDINQQYANKIEMKDEEIQVDLTTPILEQNKLLLERLHEDPEPKGKELIIINSAQAIELRRQMETLKQEVFQLINQLVLRLNHYNNLIQDKQLTQIKKNIKVDINHFYENYLQMFKNINRPIEDVEQIGKILSPIYQDDLNEFLSSLSDFLEKFRLVSIL